MVPTSLVWANGGCPHCSTDIPLPRRTAPGSADGPEATVCEWIDAFNARDFDRVLAPLKSEVALHPLRLDGIGSVYRGHVGVLQWLGELERGGLTHRLALGETRIVRDHAVLAVGGVALAERAGETPFCGIFEFGGPQIVSIRHYFGHPETLAEIGMIDEPTADRGRQ